MTKRPIRVNDLATFEFLEMFDKCVVDFCVIEEYTEYLSFSIRDITLCEVSAFWGGHAVKSFSYEQPCQALYIDIILDNEHDIDLSCLLKQAKERGWYVEL